MAGVSNCLSALVAAERYDDLLALLELAPYKMWHYRQYGVTPLAAQGKKAEAIRYADRSTRRGGGEGICAVTRDHAPVQYSDNSSACAAAPPLNNRQSSTG